jgi:hypothetical protein
MWIWIGLAGFFAVWIGWAAYARQRKWSWTISAGGGFFIACALVAVVGSFLMPPHKTEQHQKPAAPSLHMARNQVLAGMESIITERSEAPLGNGETREMVRIGQLYALELIGPPRDLRKVSITFGLASDPMAAIEVLGLIGLTIKNVVPQWRGDETSAIGWLANVLEPAQAKSVETKRAASVDTLQSGKKVTLTVVNGMPLAFISIEPVAN